MLADRTDNRSGSYAIPIGHTCASFALPLPVLPYFRAFSLPVRRSSFHFILSFLPSFARFRKQIRDTRRSVLHAVLCHTRQQARKSNFHRETYYQPSREYDVPRRNTREWHGSHCRSHSIESADFACGNSPIVPTWTKERWFRRLAFILLLQVRKRDVPLYTAKVRRCSLSFAISWTEFTERVLRVEQGEKRVARVGPTFLNHATNFQLFSVVNKPLERTFLSFL